MIEDWLQLAVWGSLVGLLLAAAIVLPRLERTGEQRGFDVKPRGDDDDHSPS